MKKSIAIILSALIILCCFAFAACDNGNTKTTGKETSNKTDETGTGEQKSTGKPWPTEKLPDGTVFKILGRAMGATDWTAEELTEEAVNDAVYTRNEWLKENYNFEITHNVVVDAAWTDTARTSSKANDGAYDLYVGGGRYLSPIAQEGYLVDLASEEKIDLNDPYWDQNSIKDLSIANRVYMISGDIQTTDIGGIYCIFVNKDVLMEKEDYENPYQLVRDNEWTMDKMLEIAREYTVDDGDGIWNEKDRYGYVCENYDGYAMYFCSGERVVTKDDDDLPIFCGNTSRAIEFVGKLKEFYSDNSIFVNYARVIVPIAKEQRALFCATTLFNLPSYREYEGDYGILPLPMYESTQNGYSHSVSCATTGSLLGVPSAAADVDQAVYMFDIICRKSTDTLRYAYMENSVKSRGLRDEDSYEMLEIIVNSKVYDVAYMNGWGPTEPNGWMNYFYRISTNPSLADTYASTLDSDTEATNKEIQATIDAYQANF